MLSLLAVALISFGLTYLLTPLCRNFAVARGWVDHPGHRKIHRRPVPRLGGVPVFAAFAAACGLLLATGSAGSGVFSGNLGLVLRILPAIAVVFLVGLADDLFSLTPWHKLAGQTAAALLACTSGVVIHAIAGHPLPAWCAWTITVLWLVGCANAVNLIDGVDGLATGVALCAALTMFAAACFAANYPLQFATAPLIGALLGFLGYNFNPASIFLGDCGSLTLGFLLGCYGVVWTSESATLLGMTAPLIALALPFADTAVAILRRLRSGQRIFTADRGHIHHRLLDRGLTPRRVALLMYAICGIAACVSLVQSFAGSAFAGAVLVVFCIGAGFGIHQLDFPEWRRNGRGARRDATLA